MINISNIINVQKKGDSPKAPLFSFRDIVGFTSPNNFGWAISQRVDPSRIALCNSEQPQRVSGNSVSITVEPGDNPTHTFGTERNEFSVMFANGLPFGNDENSLSGTQFYAISIYLPLGWQDTSSFCIISQLHPPDSNPSNAGSPAFAIDLSMVPGHYTLSQRGGVNFNSIARKNTDLGTHIYDQWVDFVFQVKWAIDNTGYTAVWTRVNESGALLQQKVNGGALSPWNTPTLYGNNGIVQNHYWKRGCYRNAELFTTQFFASPLVRALTFDDATKAVFG